MTELTPSYVIKNSPQAVFSFYRQGYLYYTVDVAIEEESGEMVCKTYVFPIEVSDLQTATVSKTEKPITLMRYIRKALADGTFVRSL